MSWADFKSASIDTGNWLWGTAQGGFNEKQTIGQVVTDAVISMFPIAGEVTAARDVIAASIRLAQYPEKRQEALEWVSLVLPLLALVPLLGGALKGIGKLVLMAGKHADEDKKIFEACVWLLNKVGEGNAVKFIKELDFTTYAAPIVKNAKEVMRRISDGIDALIAKYGLVIPDGAIKNMLYIKEQLAKVTSLVDSMVPQALKDLNNKLKLIQKLAYEGEWHAIPGAGKAITRETEARLVHDAVHGKEVWKLENAKFPANTKVDFVPVKEWPDLVASAPGREINGKIVKDYGAIEAFHGPMVAKPLPVGTIIYRVVTPDKRSLAEGPWWTVIDPKSIKGIYWRIKFAVLQSWSANGKYVKYIVKDKPLHAWEGKVSSQIDQAKTLRDGSPNKAFGQYLEGGETQLYLDFNHASNAHAKADVSALAKQDTNWIEHLDINIPERGATVQKLGKEVIEQKTLASANLATAANQANHGVRASQSNQNK
jgi:hypothetical protein